MSKGAPIVDLGRWQRTIIPRPQPDGSYLMDRLPAGRSIKMVNMAGTVVPLPLSNAMANRAPNDAYGLQQEFAKIRKGFVPYNRCPQTLMSEGVYHLPPGFHGKTPCTKGTDGEKLGWVDQRRRLDNHCKCIDELIAFRKAAQDRKMAGLEAQSQSSKQADQLTQVLDKLTDVVAASQPPKRGRPPADG